MADLYLAIAINLTLCTALALLAYRIARRRALALTLIPACILLLALNLWKWRDTIWPAHLFPFSNMIFLADLSPPLVGLLTGLAARSLPGHPARRAVLLIPLCVLCLWGAYFPLWQRPTELHDDNHWQNGVCRQSTPTTCTPAAAATLLAAKAIHTTEREMAHLCLTTTGGTRMRGLYRGLQLKTAGTQLAIKPFHGGIPDLAKAVANGPLILTVRLDPNNQIDPRFEKEWGWAPGVAHHIVVFRQNADGLFEVGDPAIGREYWDNRALRALWHGEGLQLVQR